MFKAFVTVPVVGVAYVEVESERDLTEEEWIKRALTVKNYKVEEMKLVQQVTKRNICYCPINKAMVCDVKYVVDER